MPFMPTTELQVPAAAAAPVAPPGTICEPGSVSHGRWVADPRECTYRIFERQTMKTLHMIEYDDQNPNCWMHDDLSVLGEGCMNRGCRMANMSTWRGTLHNGVFQYQWQPYTCSVPMYTDQMIRECFIENDWDMPRIEVNCCSVSPVFHLAQFNYP